MMFLEIIQMHKVHFIQVLFLPQVSLRTEQAVEFHTISSTWLWFHSSLIWFFHCIVIGCYRHSIMELILSCDLIILMTLVLKKKETLSFIVFDLWHWKICIYNRTEEMQTRNMFSHKYAHLSALWRVLFSFNKLVFWMILISNKYRSKSKLFQSLKLHSIDPTWNDNLQTTFHLLNIFFILCLFYYMY